MSRSEYPSRFEDKFQKLHRREKYAAIGVGSTSCETNLSNKIYLAPCYKTQMTCYPWSYHSRAQLRIQSMNDANRSIYKKLKND